MKPNLNFISIVFGVMLIACTSQPEMRCEEIVDARLQSFPFVFDEPADLERWVKANISDNPYCSDEGTNRQSMRCSWTRGKVKIVISTGRSTQSASVYQTFPYGQAPALKQVISCFGNPKSYSANTNTGSGVAQLFNVWYPEKGWKFEYLWIQPLHPTIPIISDLTSPEQSKKITNSTYFDYLIYFPKTTAAEDYIDSLGIEKVYSSAYVAIEKSRIKTWTGDVSKIKID